MNSRDLEQKANAARGNAQAARLRGADDHARRCTAAAARFDRQAADARRQERIRSDSYHDE